MLMTLDDVVRVYAHGLIDKAEARELLGLPPVKPGRPKKRPASTLVKHGRK